MHNILLDMIEDVEVMVVLQKSFVMTIAVMMNFFQLLFHQEGISWLQFPTFTIAPLCYGLQSVIYGILRNHLEAADATAMWLLRGSFPGWPLHPAGYAVASGQWIK